jgi:ligand-binding sensor domain-containing protein/signal transduction histidine kinase
VKYRKSVLNRRSRIEQSSYVSVRMPRNQTNLSSEPASAARTVIALTSLALAFGFAPAASALDPSTPLPNYIRQTWVMENGLPQNTVTALVQTHDGFVWLGTEVGLVRFDGNSFQIFDRTSLPTLPDNDICCLLEAPDGAMWIGTSSGLVRWDGSQMMRAYTARDGLPDSGILGVAITNGGAILAATNQGIAQLSGDRFIALKNLHAGRVLLAQTSGAAVWADAWQTVDTTIGAWKRSVGQAGLQPDQIDFTADLPEGSKAFASKTLLVVERGDRVLQRLAAGRNLPGGRIQALMADREGGLWIGMNDGLARLANGKLQTMSLTDPLATLSILSLMEDREGNVWVGTETGGLHILRDQRFKTIDTREGLTSDATTAVVEDKAETLWVGTQNAGLNKIQRSDDGTIKVRNWTLRDGLMSDLILSLAPAPNGDMWAGTPDGLNRIRGGRVDAFTSADGLPDDFIRSLLADSDGSLWIGTRRGLVHWTGAARYSPSSRSQAGMEILTHANGLGSDTVGALARDAAGDLWVATFGGLSRLHAGKISNYTVANGLSSNIPTALLPLGNGTLLIGTQDRGWDIWDGRSFSIATTGGLNQESIHAILNDSEGHLWFATGNGIARCNLNTPGTPNSKTLCSDWLEFGTADGLRSRETAANSHPSAVRTRDGHLWFTTPKGLLEVDPVHFPVNTVAPPVAMERFAVDDVEQSLRPVNSLLKIAAGHVHFQFDYAGLSFTAPLKVRYRYRLEGFDLSWTDAGTRRSAYYTNIPPGKYTFRVQAANNDGLWNTAGTAFQFELRPHFYQTLWFYALLLAAMTSGIVLLMKRRLRAAEREFRAVLGERSRIAREIHDTLAQGYVGISVQLETLAELLRQNKVDAASKQLNTTREYVREGLADARQSIWALRTPDSQETTLPVKLRRLAETAGDNGLAVEFRVFGAYRPLAADIEREVLRIAQEAIHNVKKHAGASRLSVQLRYEPAAIELEVRDDGKGGASDHGTATQGSYGLTGMRERAQSIRGMLEVNSAAGEGTVIRLRAPAAATVRLQTGEQE